jgi:hypothetical protein
MCKKAVRRKGLGGDKARDATSTPAAGSREGDEPAGRVGSLDEQPRREVAEPMLEEACFLAQLADAVGGLAGRRPAEDADGRQQCRHEPGGDRMSDGSGGALEGALAMPGVEIARIHEPSNSVANSELRQKWCGAARAKLRSGQPSHAGNEFAAAICHARRRRAMALAETRGVRQVRLKACIAAASAGNGRNGHDALDQVRA